MLNKILIPIVIILILTTGIDVSFLFPKPAFSEPKNVRDYFFEVHMEPSNANEGMFNTLAEFVNLADQYNLKLTLLFTPQWAEMILKDDKKLNLLHRWQRNGHEIGGHHHGPSVCPWDGYTNLDPQGQEFKSRQNRVPCPPFVRAKERYFGDMNDYMKLLNNFGPIKTITMSDEDIDWPEGALYAAGGRRLEGAISQPKMVIFNGQRVYKLTSCPLEPKKLVTGIQITIDELKNAYLSEREGIFGVGNHPEGYRDNPDLYKQWFEFLKEQDPERTHSKTISQIIEGRKSVIRTEGNYSDSKAGLKLELQEVRDNIEIYRYIMPTENTIMNGYILKPKGDGPFPAVVLNHGGYGSAELFGIDNGIILAKNGYVAIACDYTHKELRSHGVNGPKRGWEAGASEENIARALKNIEILKNLKYVDTGRIAMLGNSMGGFLAVGVAQRTKDLKAAVVIVAGIKDGNPQTPADRIIEVISSPEDLVKDISCPVLLLNGEDDTKVNVKYPKYLKELLDRYGKVSKLIVYSNIGHELLRVYSDKVYGEIFGFLDEHMH